MKRFITVALLLYASTTPAAPYLCSIPGPQPLAPQAHASCDRIARRVCRLCERRKWQGVSFCTHACTLSYSNQPCDPAPPSVQDCCSAGIQPTGIDCSTACLVCMP